MKQWIPLAVSKKIRYFRNFRSKSWKTSSSLPLHMCWKVLPCFMAISAWIYVVLPAMKRGNEALNASSLQFLSSVKRFIASLLKFFLRVKRFITVTFLENTSFNASSPLLLKRNSLLNASLPLLFKVTLPTFNYHLWAPYVPLWAGDIIIWAKNANQWATYINFRAKE